MKCIFVQQAGTAILIIKKFLPSSGISDFFPWENNYFCHKQTEKKGEGKHKNE